MEKLQAEEKRLAALVQEREDEKLKIIGKMMLERMEKDSELEAWFEQEIDKRLSNPRERDLFFLKSPSESGGFRGRNVENPYLSLPLDSIFEIVELSRCSSYSSWGSIGPWEGTCEKILIL